MKPLCSLIGMAAAHGFRPAYHPISTNQQPLHELFLQSHDSSQMGLQNLVTPGSIKDIAECQYATKTAFFNLAGITNGNGQSSQQVEQYTPTGSIGQNQVEFNWCQANIPASTICPSVDNTFAHIDAGGKCFGLSEDKDTKSNTFATEIKNAETGNVDGITLNFVGGAAPCVSRPTEPYKLTVNLHCSEGHVSQPHFMSSNNDACDIVLDYESKQGCAVFSMSKFISFLKEYYYLWGAILIVLGIFLAFFGNKFVTAVIYVVAMVAIFLVLTGLFFELFLEKVGKVWVQWLIVAIILVLANVAAFFLAKYRKFGVAALSTWGGVMVGFVITNTFFITSAAAYWCVVVGMGVLFGLVAFFTEKHVIIFVTSFVGSYSLIRGISLYAGGFPNEIELHNEIESGAVDWASFNKGFYGYLAGIVILTVLSLYFQVKHNTRQENKWGA